MLRRFFIPLIALIMSYSVNSQSLNTYKYVVVPDSYDFLKGEKDRYQLNSLTQFLFKKYGFTAILKGEPFPEDLENEGCNALYANVNNASSMFTIKLAVELKDCKNTIVFTSQPGRSKSKEFKKGYQEALRAAFMDVKKLNYFYKAPKKTTGIVANKAQEKIAVQPAIAVADPVPPTEVTVLDKKLALPNTSKIVTNEVPSPITSTANKPISTTAKTKKVIYLLNGATYDMKKVDNGYTLHQILADGSSKALGTIFTTSRANNYIVKAESLSGNGYFDSFGNFVLERINPATGKVITDTFAREDR